MTQVLLERSAADRLDGATPVADWQDHLFEQTAVHPLFRRRRLQVSGGKGKVILTGVVTSFYEKQLAQEFVRRCAGVGQIDNQIEVAYTCDQP